MVRPGCNIDTRGRVVRGVSGVLCVLIALWLLTGGPTWESNVMRWTVICAVGGLGVFQIYESYRGWCVARAMGFRTPL